MDMKARIYKSTTNKKIFGVCQGIADYFEIDVTWVRLAFAICALCVSTGLWVYLICAIVFPKDTEVIKDTQMHPTGNKIKCTHCGCEYDAAFKGCPLCGTSTIPKKEMKRCSKCGCEIEENDVFCFKCGEKIN